MEYSYPIRHDWTTEEIILIAAFYDSVEKAYETGIKREQMLSAYSDFKKVVPSMAEEKTLFKEFEDVSGYSSYRVVKDAKDGEDGETIRGAQR